MRPSETAALTWADVNLEAGTVSINKSRNMGTTAATKTANSERIIPVDEPLLAILKLLPSRELGLEHVLSASVAIQCQRNGLSTTGRDAWMRLASSGAGRSTTVGTRLSPSW